MRKILFRGKDENLKWRFGSLWIDTSDDYKIIEDGVIYSVDVTTVGQFTGIYDIDGEAIYEGSIVRQECYSHYNGVAWGREYFEGRVAMHDGIWMIENADGTDGKLLFNEILENKVII